MTALPEKMKVDHRQRGRCRKRGHVPWGVLAGGIPVATSRNVGVLSEGRVTAPCNQIFSGMMPHMLIVILCMVLTLWLQTYLYGN
jgi:hypothetical protein